MSKCTIVTSSEERVTYANRLERSKKKLRKDCMELDLEVGWTRLSRRLRGMTMIERWKRFGRGLAMSNQWALINTTNGSWRGQMTRLWMRQTLENWYKKHCKTMIVNTEIWSEKIGINCRKRTLSLSRPQKDHLPKMITGLCHHPDLKELNFSGRSIKEYPIWWRTLKIDQLKALYRKKESTMHLTLNMIAQIVLPQNRHWSLQRNASMFTTM